MPRISEMPSPGALVGLELVPALQGGGPDGNVGVPLLATGAPFGGAVLALRAPMTADLSDTTDADPGPGAVRWNNANPALATVLFIDHEDGEASSLATILAGLAVGGFVYLQGGAAYEDDPLARDNLQKWQVTSVTAAAGYTKVGVSPQAMGGAFADGDALELTLQQPLPAPGLDRGVSTPVVSAAGTTTLDASLGDYFTTTLSENTAVAVVNAPQACTLSLRIMQDAATARTVAWPASFRWPSGHNKLVSTTLGARDRLVMTTDDFGATWDCVLGKGHAA